MKPWKGAHSSHYVSLCTRDTDHSFLARNLIFGLIFFLIITLFGFKLLVTVFHLELWYLGWENLVPFSVDHYVPRSGSRAIWLCKLIFLLFWLAYSPKYPKTWGHNFPTPTPFSRGHILDDDVIQHNPNAKTQTSDLIIWLSHIVGFRMMRGCWNYSLIWNAV